jgi:hypothetical protein
VGFEHAFLAEMVEEFSSGDVFHEHVDIFGVLGDTFEINLNGGGGTIKGWLIELRILYSLEMWSTCWDLISSSFFMILTQEYFVVCFFFTSFTFPKEPTS